MINSGRIKPPNIINSLFIISLIFTSAFAFSTAALASPQEYESEKSLEGVHILWDMVSGGGGHAPGGYYSEMGRILEEMGATIVDLGFFERYTDEVLENIDFIIINGRSIDFETEEIETISRFVNEGGGLLMLFSMATKSPAKNLLTKYGINVGDSAYYQNIIEILHYPATTRRRPVVMGLAERPMKMAVAGNAMTIASRESSPGSTDGTNPCYGALGYGGKGRVLAFGDLGMWRSSGC